MAETQENHRTGFPAAVPAPLPTPKLTQMQTFAFTPIQGDGVWSASLFLFVSFVF